MFNLARSVRKQGEAKVKVEGEVAIDLEEFLRSASPIVDGESAPAREAAPSELSLDLDARLDEALRQTFPASDPIAVSPAHEHD